MGNKRVLVLGSTGTIGRATVRTLLAQGYSVTCLIRADRAHPVDLPQAATLRQVELSDPAEIADIGLGSDRFDIVISCMASRDGHPDQVRDIEYQIPRRVFEAVQANGDPHVILLSAICVQTPRLAFQFAKLELENWLTASGLRYSIVRPTAYFKSLSGQIDRVRQGKPFLLFGKGDLTACTPISDDDLATYICGCITKPDRMNQTLPIGGPGPAITPRAQGQMLFDALDLPPKFREVPIALMKTIAGTLGGLSRVFPGLRGKAEFARIGLYYATESMLVFDPETQTYRSDLTPSTGSDRLEDHYRSVAKGEIHVDLGEHAVF